MRALQIAAVQIPTIGGFFDVVPLGLRHWGIAAAIASTLLGIEEARKAIARRHLRRPDTSPAPGQRQTAAR